MICGGTNSWLLSVDVAQLGSVLPHTMCFGFWTIFLRCVAVDVVVVVVVVVFFPSCNAQRVMMFFFENNFPKIMGLSRQCGRN